MPSPLERFFEMESRIRGAMPLECGHLIAAVVRASEAIAGGGDLVEIGVLEGRSALPAAAVRGEGCAFVAVDPFETIDDDPGLRAGGVAERQAFEANWQRIFGDDAPGPEIHATTAKAWARATGDQPNLRRFRYASVDGDHRYEATLEDLGLMAGRLVPGGVIALDDVFNPEWPSVGQALAEFLGGADGPADFLPFAIGWNKVFLCPSRFFEAYQEHTREGMELARPFVRPALRRKEAFAFFGVRPDVYTNRWGNASRPLLEPEGYLAGFLLQRLARTQPGRAQQLMRLLERLSPAPETIHLQGTEPAPVHTLPAGPHASSSHG